MSDFSDGDIGKPSPLSAAMFTFPLSTNGAFADTEAFMYVYARIDVFVSLCYDGQAAASFFLPTRGKNTCHVIHARLHQTPPGQMIDVEFGVT